MGESLKINEIQIINQGLLDFESEVAVLGWMQRELLKHLSPTFLQTFGHLLHPFFWKIFGQSRS